MANEIRITVISIEGSIDATTKVGVTFDVYHNADAVFIAQDEYIKGPATENELKERVERRAKELYAEYEQQKVWFGYTLPKSWNIDG